MLVIALRDTVLQFGLFGGDDPIFFLLVLFSLFFHMFVSFFTTLVDAFVFAIALFL